MSDWRLISTAPRDGTVITVGVPGEEEVSAMLWNPIGSNAVFQPDPVGIWETPEGTFTWSEDRGFGPTHWKPIP